MENVTVNILGCAIVFFFSFWAGIIYRRKNTVENFKPSHNTQRDEICADSRGACMNIGYYWVKHFNHIELKIMYFNGFRFEKFASDNRINDEIESYIEVAPPDTMECANLLHTTRKVPH